MWLAANVLLLVFLLCCCCCCGGGCAPANEGRRRRARLESHLPASASASKQTGQGFALLCAGARLASYADRSGDIFPNYLPPHNP